MEYGVPMALSTDDEGVSRIDLTHEYQRAAQTFDLSYARLRALSRNALQYNFLPGDALFDDTYKGKISGPCANQSAAEELNSGCAAFLDASEKAALQWDLEKRFAAFEASFD
jgi:adenosine deaminase